MTIFCRDCKHITFIDKRTVCTANPDIVDYVTGITRYKSAASCRAISSECGKSGSKFEYAGIFGKSCKNCNYYHSHDKSCSGVYDTKRLPIEEAIPKYCTTGLKHHNRNIWLTIANSI